MTTAVQQPSSRDRARQRVAPSNVSPATSSPYTPAQELEPFGTWTGNPIWVPPKDSSRKLAKSMLRRFGLFDSKSECWEGMIGEHRDEFQQVREIDLCKASIRLPKGKLFVSVTEREQFDEITDPIPACVQTRLDEFLDGPGKKKGVKVYYLKPLCVELGDELIFTTHESVAAAIQQIQKEVFSEYRRMYLYRRPLHMTQNAVNLGLKIPGGLWKRFTKFRNRELDAYHSRLEFKRRQTALGALNALQDLHTDNSTFEEMLALTNPLQRDDVIEQFSIERNLSRAKRNRMLRSAAEVVPWFVTLSIGLSYLSTISLSFAPPLLVCDPAFVAEMPGSKGVVLKVGHFDEVRGVTHVEI